MHYGTIHYGTIFTINKTTFKKEYLANVSKLDK